MNPDELRKQIDIVLGGVEDYDGEQRDIDLLYAAADAWEATEKERDAIGRIVTRYSADYAEQVDAIRDLRKRLEEAEKANRKLRKILKRAADSDTHDFTWLEDAYAALAGEEK